MNQQITKILRNANISKCLSKDEILLMLTLWNDKMFDIFKAALKDKLKNKVITKEEYDNIVDLSLDWKKNSQSNQDQFIRRAKGANEECLKEFVAFRDEELKQEIEDLDEIDKILDNN